MRLGARQAAARVEARLGRAAQDALEAAVVLEAWGGLRPFTAMELGTEVAQDVTTQNSYTQPAGRQSHSELVRGLCLITVLGSVLACIDPLSAAYGSAVVRSAWELALPAGLGAHWALRRRYLDGPDGLGRLRGDWRSLASWVGLLVVAASFVLGAAGALAGVLLVVWITAFVVVDRGWGIRFAVALAGVGVVMRAEPPGWVAIALLFVPALGALMLAISTASQSSRVPGAWKPTLGAALTGAGLGAVIVLGEAGRQSGATSAGRLTSAPILVGTFWAAHRLGRFWKLSENPFDPGVGFASTSSRWVIGVFAGSLARLAAGACGTFLLLTALLPNSSLSLGGSLVVSSLCIGLVVLICTLLEGMGRFAWSALVAIGAVIGMLVESGGAQVLHFPAPAVGAGTAVILALPPIVGLLRRPHRALTVAML